MFDALKYLWITTEFFVIWFTIKGSIRNPTKQPRFPRLPMVRNLVDGHRLTTTEVLVNDLALKEFC